MKSESEQIRSLAIEYAEGVDRRRFDAVAELFLESGTLEPPGALRSGRRDIAAALEGLRRYSGTFHHLGQRRIQGQRRRPRRQWTSMATKRPERSTARRIISLRPMVDAKIEWCSFGIRTPTCAALKGGGLRPGASRSTGWRSA